MNWKDRWVRLVLAGGSLAGAVGCHACCNANPDPCCLDPSTAACAAWEADDAECVDAGGVKHFEESLPTGAADSCVLPDGGVIIFPDRLPDGGTDPGP